MSTRTFSWYVNRFEVSTRGSYNVAAAVGTQHVNSLFTDSTTVPIALTCYDNVKPSFDLFQAARIAQTSQSGSQGGTVLTFNQLLNTMPLTVDTWQTSIKVFYAENTAKYKVLFPKGKSTFNKGKQQNRVNAVATLIASIGSDTNLATVKIIIQTFYTTLLAAFNNKDNSKTSTVTDSTALETARINLCNEMEGNYGLLLNAYKTNPTLCAKYFDESLLKKDVQALYKLSVLVSKTKNAFKRTFASPVTQQLQIINTTNATALVFLSDSKTGVVGTVFVTIAPMSTSTFLLSDCGDNATQPFLNIVNQSTLIKAQLTIKIL